jgi:hypothetical protein
MARGSRSEKTQIFIIYSVTVCKCMDFPLDQDTKTPTFVSKGPNPVWNDLLLVLCNKEQIFSKNAELKLEVLHRSSRVGKNIRGHPQLPRL